MLSLTTVKDDTSKRKACELLTSRLASSKLTIKDNAQLIVKLLGQSKGEIHCHLSKQPLAAKELKAFCCAIGTVELDREYR